MEKLRDNIGIVLILCLTLIGCVGIIAMTAEKTATENQAENTYITCGSCGAHVHNWWYVENINNGEPVEVCEFCYNNYIENTATEN